MNNKLCFLPADILLPKKGFEKWSVIACDQYTSEPEYWQRVKETVGDAPSALNIILPEVYLKTDNSQKIAEINRTMCDYEKSGVFNTYNNTMVYVERIQSDGKLRRGIVGKIDLTEYDYHPGSTAAIRATEQTVISRIPPRVEIRRNALLEMPHVMLLIDDPDGTVIEPLSEKKNEFAPLYDFDLMQGAGHITGMAVSQEAKDNIAQALCELKEKNNGFLFCVGDGNHSLAAAKECYNLSKNENSRYALVEVVNIHDTALEFEPIYRVVFGVNPQELISSFVSACGGAYDGSDAQKFTCVYGNTETEISVKPISKLSVGTLQNFLDSYIKVHSEAEIDYIHGVQSLKKLSARDNAVGFLFEGMQKSELFPAVASDGSLPRKTFSMGHADDKRFYLEARKIY